MNRLLVIGGASFDVLHLENRTVECLGGAGMYTAMAARRSGAEVSLFGPRPDPLPECLKAVAGHLVEWLGPLIPPEQMLQIEIDYRGGKTEYLKTSLEAETTLSTKDLPSDLSKYDLVHVTPLGDASRQYSFIQKCRALGAKKISAGTGLFIVDQQAEIVCEVIRQSDYFFMNLQEAEALFGSLESTQAGPGKVIFVTLGSQGACIIQGAYSYFIPGVLTTELDPTGAGDTFCGATLANLLQVTHPVMAARCASALAAEMITRVGPNSLLLDDPPPEPPHDPRVQVDREQVQKVAQLISTLPEATPFPFVLPFLPPAGHPQALDNFFAFTLQQFGFWTVKNNHYHQSLIARIGGAELKGTDYLWAAYWRRIERDPEFVFPERQANLSRGELLQVFRADDGTDPMPALDLHLEQAHQYGRDMLALQLMPQAVLEKVLSSGNPLQTFMVLLDQIGGYKEDPLRKKSALLAMILNQRPEGFLPLREDEQIPPVIDYHAMRSCLRFGLVEVLDDALRSKLRDRQIVSPDEEWAVRYTAYRAVEALVELSSKSMGAVDWFLYSARGRCPEMSEPDCPSCQMDPVCAHRVELFQPVLRTSFY